MSFSARALLSASLALAASLALSSPGLLAQTVVGNTYTFNDPTLRPVGPFVASTTTPPADAVIFAAGASLDQPILADRPGFTLTMDAGSALLPPASSLYTFRRTVVGGATNLLNTTLTNSSVNTGGTVVDLQNGGVFTMNGGELRRIPSTPTASALGTTFRSTGAPLALSLTGVNVITGNTSSHRAYGLDLTGGGTVDLLGTTTVTSRQLEAVRLNGAYTFTNAATLRRLSFDGSDDAQAVLIGGGVTTFENLPAGRLESAADAALVILPTAGGSTIENAGFIAGLAAFDSNTAIDTENLSVINSGQIAVSPTTFGAMRLGPGSVTNAAGGTIASSNNGTATVTFGNLFQDSAPPTLSNAGAITHAGHSSAVVLQSKAGFSVLNLPSGQLLALAPASFSSASAIQINTGTGGTFTNQGVIRGSNGVNIDTAGDPTATAPASISLVNSGEISGVTNTGIRVAGSFYGTQNRAITITNEATGLVQGGTTAPGFFSNTHAAIFANQSGIGTLAIDNRGRIDARSRNAAVGITVSDSARATLTLHDGSITTGALLGLTLSPSFATPPDITLAVRGAGSFEGRISGFNEINKTDAGLWTLSGERSNGHRTVVTAGELRFTGLTQGFGTATTVTGGLLHVVAPTPTSSGALNFNTERLTVSGEGTLRVGPTARARAVGAAASPVAIHTGGLVRADGVLAFDANNTNNYVFAAQVREGGLLAGSGTLFGNARLTTLGAFDAGTGQLGSAARFTLDPGSGGTNLIVGDQGRFRWTLATLTESGPGVNFDVVEMLNTNAAVRYEPGARFDLDLSAVTLPDPSEGPINAFWNTNRQWTFLLGGTVVAPANLLFAATGQATYPIPGAGTFSFTPDGRTLLWTTEAGPAPTPNLVVQNPTATPVASGATRDFVPTPVGQTRQLLFTLANTGGAPLGSLQAALSGPDSPRFAITTAPASTLAPAATTNVVVTFTPTTEGTRTATLTLTSDDPDQPVFTVLLSAVALAPEPQAQTILFSVPTLLTYGSAPITVSAEASSGLPVTVTYVSGPATLTGTQLAFTGAGTVVLRANQAGDASFEAAPEVERSITINPAFLTVTATSQSRAVGIANPPLTVSYAGFVGTDGPASLATAPVATTNATIDSPAGTYPITASGGQAANYVFTYVPGSLTITAAPLLPQSITFPTPASRAFGSAPAPLVATAAPSGLPVTFEVVSGPGSIASDGRTLSLTGEGVITVRARQPGDATYAAAAPVERTVRVTPATLVLGALAQTYDSTPRAVTVSGVPFGFEDDLVVTYNGSATVPDDAGRYSVVATLGTARRTGTLVIAKRTLTITADDQRKFAGQPNPPLTFAYSGFVGTDTALTALTRLPTISTTAQTTSPGGIYPIRVTGAVSANYALAYVPGELLVESFTGNHEALLDDPVTGRPVAKLELTIARNGVAYSGKLSVPTEDAVFPFKGSLVVNGTSETASLAVTIQRGTDTYALTASFALDEDFAAELTRDGSAFAAAADGKRVFIPARGEKLSWVGAHTLTLGTPQVLTEDARPAPLGGGHATATIDTKGNLKLAGVLAEGTKFSATLAPDSDGGYRLYARPYGKCLDSFLIGWLNLQDHPDLEGRRHLPPTAEAELFWQKAPGPKDSAYRAGFGPLATSVRLDPWLRPTGATRTAAAVSLAQRLGLATSPTAIARFGLDYLADSLVAFSPAQIAGLPASFDLAVSGSPTIPRPAPAQFALKFNPSTGVFSGSFSLSDVVPAPTTNNPQATRTVTRKVTVAGILRQAPASAPDSTFGLGYLTIPSLEKGGESASGVIELRQVAP